MKLKPVRIEKDFYNFIEMCDIINKVLGYDQRDAGKHFFPESVTFDEWCDQKGYGDTDPEGKHRGSSQIWFREFKTDLESGIIQKVPYLDFWHWQLDHAVGHNFQNDSYSTVCVSPRLAADSVVWIQEIQQVWYDTFKDIADEDGIIDIWVSW